MEEAAENGKESSHSARASGFNEHRFFLDCLTLRMKAIRSLETLGTAHALTWPNVTEGKSSGSLLLLCY
jgi:hypothetical protein